MSKSSIMAVISVLFMIFAMLIMYHTKLAYIMSIILWLGSAGYSVYIFAKEKKSHNTLKKEGNNNEK